MEQLDVVEQQPGDRFEVVGGRHVLAEHVHANSLAIYDSHAEVVYEVSVKTHAQKWKHAFELGVQHVVR